MGEDGDRAGGMIERDGDWGMPSGGLTGTERVRLGWLGELIGSEQLFSIEILKKCYND